MILQKIKERLKKKENSAGGVVFFRGEKGAQYLLEMDKYGFWAFPKGHVEKGENSLEAAIREIQEETGIGAITKIGNLDKLTLEFVKDYDGSNDRIKKQVKMYLFQAKDASLKRGDHEAKWMYEGEVLENLKYENALKVFKKAVMKVKKWKN